jgi:hypothetical protein
MPPQQPQRLLDFFDQILSFRAHDLVHPPQGRRSLSLVGI